MLAWDPKLEVVPTVVTYAKHDAFTCDNLRDNGLRTCVSGRLFINETSGFNCLSHSARGGRLPNTENFSHRISAGLTFMGKAAANNVELRVVVMGPNIFDTGG